MGAALETNPVRVLCMEDNPSLARLIQKRLEQAGHVVDLASDGHEGLDMCQRETYDVVTVAQSLSGCDGLQVIRFLGTDGALPPAIVMTGVGDERTALEAMKLGAGDYVVKDTDGGYLDLLPMVIEQVLNQRRLAEEKRQALEELERRTRDLVRLNQLGQVLTATLDVPQVTDQLLRSAVDIVGGVGGSIWLWDEEREGWLRCRSILHPGLGRSTVDLRLTPGEGIAGWVAQSGKSVVVPDASADPRYTPNIDAITGFHTTSLLAVPLRVRDEVTGVLEVVNQRRDQFSDHDLFLVETLAASAGIAIENARLIEALRQ